MKKEQKRRDFIRKFSVGGILIGGTSKGLLSQNAEEILAPKIHPSQNYSQNDQIQLAMIGCGIQGFSNARSAMSIDGIKIVAACDLYTGRLERMKEVYGKDLYTTQNYKEILAREDIDAVCISTTDHWHDHMTIEALKAGKAVYCEKPMVHRLSEGHRVIAAENQYRQALQIGSQRVSGIETAKAKELFESGVIGTLNLAEIRYDRASSNGAWQYSIPTDANQETIDWKAFIGDAPSVEFDPKRFFWWRNYQDYGTGVAGDLFVHLFSALHVITSSKGPERIYASGGLRFWNDGRDVPDITLGLYDYPATSSHPAFNVQMRVNFVDGSGGGSHVRLIGNEGVMTISSAGIKVKKSKVSTTPTYGGWDSYNTFSSKQQEEYKKWFESHYGPEKPKMIEPSDLEYKVPKGYSSHRDHWWYFIDSIRNGTQLVENGTFGLRAAGPALATNNSYFERRIIEWDPVTMKIV